MYDTWQTGDAGEGKLYVDRTTSGYFWLNTLDKKQQHVGLVWRRSRLSCEYALRKWREEEIANGTAAEEIESQAEVEEAGEDHREIFTEGYICYWNNVRSLILFDLPAHVHHEGKEDRPGYFRSIGQEQEGSWRKGQASRDAGIYLGGWLQAVCA
jgi:hypothetical protein